VNVIPLNATASSAFKPSPSGRVQRFKEVLLRGGVEATIRLSRGAEIRAGCGQLRGRVARHSGNGER